MYSVYYMMYILLTYSCSPYALPFCLYINNNRCPVPLWDYVDQKIYYLSNPEVRIPVDTPSSVLPYKVVPLPSLNSMSFPSIDNGEDWPVFATWFHANENGLLNTTDLEDTSACDGHPNYHQPIPNDGTVGDGSPIGKFPLVFGRTPEGVDFVYDPHLALRENTVSSPLPDGGGKLSIDTHGLKPGSGTPGEQVMCQNVEPNFLNQEGCKLSYDTSTCKPGELPRSVIELSEENVDGIRTIFGKKDIYIMKDVDMSSLVLNLDSGKDAPCGDGKQKSRWMAVEDTICENSAALDGGKLPSCSTPSPFVCFFNMGL